MQVLIIGVCGLLGQNLARAYLAKGWDVFGVDDLSSGKEEWLPYEVEFLKFDVCNEFNYIGARHDLVIYLASRKIPREGNSYEVLIQNTQGLLNMARYAMLNGTRFIYLSTSDVYGKNTVWKEDADLVLGQTDIMRWSYAVTKVWGEHLLYSMPEDFDFRIIRLFGTFGPYHALSWTAGPQSVFISQALKNDSMIIHGNGFQRRAYQFIDDAIDGIIKVAESKNCNRQVFNIGNPNEPISVFDLAKRIWEMVNPGTEPKLKFIAPSSFKYEEIMERIPDISKATRMLGFNPKVGLDEALKRTIAWQKTVV